MSWASIYWNLDHIVQAAREAMESAYAAEAALSNALTNAQPKSAVPVAEMSIVEAANLGNVDPLKTAEFALSIGEPADLNTSEKVKQHPADSLEVSLSKSSLTSTTFSGDKATAQARSRWTLEIEAALREFLRPLSISLRYEYRFPDTLDEKRSIETINSLFRQRTNRKDLETNEVSARDELRRKTNSELRRRRTSSRRDR